MPWKDEIGSVNVDNLSLAKAHQKEDAAQQAQRIIDLIASCEKSKLHVDANGAKLKAEVRMKESFVYFCSHIYPLKDENGLDIPAFSTAPRHHEILCDRIRMYLIHRAEITPGKGGHPSRPTVGTIARWRGMMIMIILEQLQLRKHMPSRILEGNELFVKAVDAIEQVCAHIAESMELPKKRREQEFFGPAEFVVLLDYWNQKMTQLNISPVTIIQDIAAVQMGMLVGVRAGGICHSDGVKSYLKESAFSFKRDLEVKDGTVQSSASSMLGCEFNLTIFKGFNHSLDKDKGRKFYLRPVTKAWNVALHPSVTLLPLFMSRGVLYEQGTNKQILTPDDLFASDASEFVVKSDAPFQQQVGTKGDSAPRTVSHLAMSLRRAYLYLGLSDQGGLHAWRHDVGDQCSVMMGYEQARTVLVHDSRRNTLENHYSRNVAHLDMIGIRLDELDDDDIRVSRLAQSRYESMQLSGNAAKVALRSMQMQGKQSNTGKSVNGRKVIMHAVDPDRVAELLAEDEIYQALAAKEKAAQAELQKVTPWDMSTGKKNQRHRILTLVESDEELVEKRKILVAAHQAATQKLTVRRSTLRKTLIIKDNAKKAKEPVQASEQEKIKAAQVVLDSRRKVILPASIIKGESKVRYKRTRDEVDEIIEPEQEDPMGDDQDVEINIGADSYEGEAFNHLDVYDDDGDTDENETADDVLAKRPALEANTASNEHTRGDSNSAATDASVDYYPSLKEKYVKGKGKEKRQVMMDTPLEPFDDTSQPVMQLFENADVEVTYQTLIRYYFGVLKGRKVFQLTLAHIKELGWCPFCEPMSIGVNRNGTFHPSDTLLKVKMHLSQMHEDIIAKIMCGRPIEPYETPSLPGDRFTPEEREMMQDLEVMNEDITEEMLAEYLSSKFAEEEKKWIASKPIREEYLVAFLSQMLDLTWSVEWPYRK